jgi:RNA polymerase sigma factor (sigma-70 family)
MRDEQPQLAERFEEHRRHLQAVAYRMLGSLSEAEDAVQEAWLRLDRADTSAVRNLGGWLTTVVGRVCLDMLRARKARREELLGETLPEPSGEADPEQEALLADSVGLALLVVLERLTPAERLAFVLHDMFDLPFDTIAPIVGRSPNTAAQLAARARRRVRGQTPDTNLRLAHQHQVVDAFLAAGRNGDLDALVALLDPDVILHVDRTAASTDSPLTVRGARAVAAGASMFSEHARHARPALVDGAVGLIVAPGGRLSIVLRFTMSAGKIVRLHICADPDRLRHLDISVLDATSTDRHP